VLLGLVDDPLLTDKRRKSIAPPAIRKVRRWGRWLQARLKTRWRMARSASAITPPIFTITPHRI
jgi:hypothetical protein